MCRLLCPALLVIVPFLCCGCNRPKSPPSKADEPLKPEFKLTADQLLDDYRKNQIGADQKYKDKLIEVTGKVASIGKVPLAGYYIDLASSGEGELGIKCFLDKDDMASEEKAAKLKEGDQVTLAGRCEGKAGGQALYLRYCYFPK
jgi:hypothetical protein